MGHKRVVIPNNYLTGKELNMGLASIGVMLGTSKPLKNYNIEDILISASIEGMEKDDLRILSLLTTWLELHHQWVNADRLFRLVQGQSHRVRAYWSSVSQWLSKDHRLKRLKKTFSGKKVHLLKVGSEFQLKKRGEDSRFKGSPIIVPVGILRNRKKDVLCPEKLAKKHLPYRYRILIGPTYRADMWAELKENPNINASDLARLTYGSFATAWGVKEDFNRLLAT